MKNLRTIAVCVSILFSSLSSFAQTQGLPVNEPNRNKPKLFLALPDNIPANMDNLSSLLSSPVGSPVSLNLSTTGNFRFDGFVGSSVSKYENAVQSVVVRSTNYPGALLNVSRITNENGNISYTARIISMQHGDLFELKKVDNEFILVKRNFYDLINE